jgi:hypothetical protein
MRSAHASSFFVRRCPSGMIPSRVPSVLLCALLLLAPTACDNPTGVGGELIERPNAGPQRVVLPLDIAPATYAPITGVTTPTAISASRVLAGQTSGAPFGDVEATGYTDFARGTTPEDVDLSSLTPDTVEVTFTSNYFYGDTTRAATFTLHDLNEEWEANGARADTSLADIVEPSPITTFSVASSDTLTTVQLPDDWVSEHAAELRAEEDSVFAEDFHGFQIRPTGGNGVVGFASRSLSMRAVFEDEDEEGEAREISFGTVRQLTTIRQPTPGASPEERYLIQDGVGRALAFDFGFPDSLRNVAVNSAELIFEVDTTFVSDEDFVRPALDGLQLYDVPLTDDGEPDEDEDATLLRGTQFAFDAEQSRFVNDFPLVALVQEILLGTSELERFEVHPALQSVQTQFGSTPVPVPSLDSRLIRHDDGHPPRLVMTYTPTGE